MLNTPVIEAPMKNCRIRGTATCWIGIRMDSSLQMFGGCRSAHNFGVEGPAVSDDRGDR